MVGILVRGMFQLVSGGEGREYLRGLQDGEEGGVVTVEGLEEAEEAEVEGEGDIERELSVMIPILEHTS